METKIIIAGGRDFNDYQRMKDVMLQIAEQYDNVSIVSGGAKGADSLAIQLAKEVNCILHVFPADWNKNGRAAGFVRNIEMADFADVLVAFWDGYSKGTEHMIKAMQNRNKRALIYGY